MNQKPRFFPYGSREEAIKTISGMIRENERLSSESDDICYREYLEELILRQQQNLEELMDECP